jgi:hypothetical protein
MTLYLQSRFRRGVVLGLALLGAATGARSVYAEQALRGSGAAGGALLGVEAALLAEAVSGVRPGWAYWVGALGGAVLGGYVGWRLEERARVDVPHTMLGAGVLLVIPTSVWFGNLREHHPRGLFAAPVREPGAGK